MRLRALVELTGTNGRGTIHHASHATRPHPGRQGARGHNARNTKHRVHPPVPGPSPGTIPRPQGWEEQQKICGGHGPGETPGPIPNPEAKAWHGDGTAKAWHGDGTAPERMWESSTPPHYTYRTGIPTGVPVFHTRQTSVLRMDATGTTWISTQVLPDTLVGGVELNPVVCRVAGLDLRLRFIERILLRR